MNDVKQVDTHIPFGKHKGKLIADLPDSYLAWLLDQEWFLQKIGQIVINKQLLKINTEKDLELKYETITI